MRRIIVPLLIVALAATAVRVAVAGAPELRGSTPPKKVRTLDLETTKVRLPPLRLPSPKALTKALMRAERPSVQKQLVASRQVVAFFENPDHRWLRALRKEKCWQVPWQRTCTIARHTHRLHSELLRAATYRLEREIPLINDWRTAVRWVQKIYPGTESWMLSISDREGGWGRWVWYGGRGWSGYHVGNDFLGADTVGGWMQFRYSTFAPYWRGAIKDLRARGYIIPEIPMPAPGGPREYAAWLSPLAQALTAGYMRYYGKDGCHWCLG